MISIDIEKSHTELSGTRSRLTTEYIVLAHTFVDAVVKKLPDDERDSFKHVIAAIFIGELGLDVLEGTGLIKGHTLVDASFLDQLFKEDDGDEADR